MDRREYMFKLSCFNSNCLFVLPKLLYLLIYCTILRLIYSMAFSNKQTKYKSLGCTLRTEHTNSKASYYLYN